MELLILFWNFLGKSSGQIVALAAALAAVSAYLGIRAWRAELKGKSEYDLAKKLLKAVYKVREAFYNVRFIGVYQYEYPEEMKGPSGHLKKEFEYEGTKYVYEARWKILQDAFRELADLNLDAQVEWGSEFQEITKPMSGCHSDLYIALWGFLDGKKNPSAWEAMSNEERKKIESKIFYYGRDPNQEKFQSQVDAAIKGFEDRLRPIIGK